MMIHVKSKELPKKELQELTRHSMYEELTKPNTCIMHFSERFKEQKTMRHKDLLELIQGNEKYFHETDPLYRL